MEDHKIDTPGGVYTVHFFPTLGSTNDKAADRIYGHGDVLITDDQTKGRGQRGNYWHTSPGMNLTFSLVVCPTFLPAPRQFLLSEAVSLAVADTLAHFGIEAMIKWPNDIYVGARKIAGILIENDICGANLSRSIAGIGLNVNETDFPAHLPNPVSMSGVYGGKFDRTEVLSTFIRCFYRRYKSLESEGEINLTADYDARIYRKGIPSRFRRPDGTVFEGVIRSVGPDGVLTIEHPSGDTEGFLFKEVELLLEH